MRITEKYTTADSRPSVQMLRRIVALLNSGGGSFEIPCLGPQAIRRQRRAVLEFTLRSVRPAAGISIQVKQTDERSLDIEVSAGLRRPYYLLRNGINPSGVYICRDGKAVSADAFEITDMISRTYGARYEAMRSFVQNLTFNQAAEVFAAQGASWSPDQFSALGITDPADGEYTNLALLISDQCPCRTAITFADETGTCDPGQPTVVEGSLLTQIETVTRELSALIRKREAAGGWRSAGCYCEEGIRAALLYAVANQDYRFQGSLRVFVYPSRIRFAAISDLLARMPIGKDGQTVSEISNPELCRLLTSLPQARKVLEGLWPLPSDSTRGRKLPVLEVTAHTMSLILPGTAPYNGRRS